MWHQGAPQPHAVYRGGDAKPSWGTAAPGGTQAHLAPPHCPLGWKLSSPPPVDLCCPGLPKSWPVIAQPPCSQHGGRWTGLWGLGHDSPCEVTVAGSLPPDHSASLNQAQESGPRPWRPHLSRRGDQQLPHLEVRPGPAESRVHPTRLQANSGASTASPLPSSEEASRGVSRGVHRRPTLTPHCGWPCALQLLRPTQQQQGGPDLTGTWGLSCTLDFCGQGAANQLRPEEQHHPK